MITFSIEQHIADIGSTNTTTKELNLVSWNNAPARLDLRNWRTDENGEQKPNRGITMTQSEAKALFFALADFFDYETA